MPRSPTVTSTLALCAGLVGACAKPPPARGGAAATQAAPTPSSAHAAAVLASADESAFDRSVAPCDDFYTFACGGWMRATPIPDDESSWFRSFSVIHENNIKLLRGILERDAGGDTSGEPFAAKLGDLWSTCMDEPAIERRALGDLGPELTAIQGVHDAPSLMRAVARLHSIGLGALFGFDSEVDFKDSAHMIAGLSQGGLGLPDRDYYFRDDPKMRAIRSEYLSHMGRTFQLLGEAPALADRHAHTVFALETELARASLENVKLRDPENVYHRVDREGLVKLAPDAAWDAYLGELGFPGIVAINVAEPDFVRQVGRLIASTKADDWQTYLRWHLAAGASPRLSHKFVDEWFRFRQVLTGVKDLQPRWKRCVGFADQLLGEALARPFVDRYLGREGKAAVERMVVGIEGAMQSDIASVAWMDEQTRRNAAEKLAKVVNKIGYPDKWRDYDAVAIDTTSFVRNVGRAWQFEVRRRLEKVGKPVDRDEWEMTPPTVNAYYDPTLNQMVFPAGILQSPFYSSARSSPANFGAIGMVVGHELTHGFDDEGRKFDAEGNLRDWWAPAVAKEFERRAACVEKQFDGYVPIDDAHVKGDLTLGENIADLGGLKLALSTVLAKSAPVATEAADTFTPVQQFFIGFAQSWCANYRPEALRLLLATNPHSPPKFRVNGPVSNLPEFAAAFQCKVGAPMARPVGQRCEVW